MLVIDTILWCCLVTSCDHRLRFLKQVIHSSFFAYVTCSGYVGDWVTSLYPPLFTSRGGDGPRITRNTPTPVGHTVQKPRWYQPVHSFPDANTKSIVTNKLLLRYLFACASLPAPCRTCIVGTAWVMHMYMHSDLHTCAWWCEYECEWTWVWMYKWQFTCAWWPDVYVHEHVRVYDES